MRPGKRNLITDIKGLYIGNSEDHSIKTGVTVLTGDRPFVAGVSVMGGAPGTRETDLLAPDKMIQEIDALVLSGGSAFGLDSASGVADELAKTGRGYKAGDANIPIVPAAILFDLLNGGNKNWSSNPYKNLGKQALLNKSEDFNQSVGVAVRIEKFSDSSIDLLVRCFTASNSWTDSLLVKERLAIAIKEIVEGNKASFAFPSQSIYIEKK